ncbi:uncharacterized protein LOC100556147 isoform X2 [Anolis carolinensis]|uniref:uncharacterized protein LOC100556147 isoform X2 n=1 Tax=Anolis carolinensis TaxID=28377 RepID=UPI002F2B171A
MDEPRKKKLTNYTIGLLFLCGGIEYGNFMYFVGGSKWMLLSSRLVAGVGTGVGASIFGYLTRSTTSQERATVFAAVMACRQVGLLIGPACNLFLRLCNFRIGPFTVNKFTSPGLFMCLVWLLLQILVVTMYYDLQPSRSGSSPRTVPTAARDALEEEEQEPLMKHETVQEEAAETGSYGSTVVEHREPSLGDECRYVPNGHLADEEEKSPFHDFSSMREYLREEVVVLLTAQFITLFNQTALETMVTPITQKYLNFGELENSIMYFLCGVEVIGGFFLVRCLSTRLTDRAILVLGLIICNIACVWCLLFLAWPRGSFAVLLTELVIGVFLQVLGLPFVAVSQVSLFSKVTAERTQGFSQGLRRSVGGIATILGPLWAGGLTDNLYIMLGVMMGLLSLLMNHPLDTCHHEHLEKNAAHEESGWLEVPSEEREMCTHPGVNLTSAVDPSRLDPGATLLISWWDGRQARDSAKEEPDPTRQLVLTSTLHLARYALFLPLPWFSAAL